MIQFIYGSSGSGKSTLIDQKIKACAEEGKQVLLLVPEQAVLSFERRLSELCGDRLSFHVQVLSFRRLANTIFRAVGGLKYDYVTKGEKAVILWRALTTIEPFLQKYRGVTLKERSFFAEMVACMDECKAYLVTPAKLEAAANALTEVHAPLADKLHDLSLLYAAYQSAMQNEFDDPADDLALLLEKLPEADFLSSYTVMIDSFYGFTGVELSIIAALFSQCTDCFITLPYDRTENIMYDSLRQTDRALRRAAEASGQELKPDILLDQHPRFKQEDLAFLEQHLWHFAATPFEKTPSHIQLVRTNDLYEEAEWIAVDIKRKVRQGRRYRDFAVITRDLEHYTGVIDAVFEKHALPAFLSKRIDITLMPSVKLILCALSIRIYNWRLDDVITYIKTGVCGLTPDECDLLENYAVTWGITGRRWTDEFEWNMNPDGYSEILTEAGAAQLQKVNELRLRVREPLLAFFECFDTDATVQSITEQLYTYINQIDFAAGLRDKAKATTEGTQVWNALMHCLDRLVYCAKDTKATPDIYRDLLTIILTEATIGKIPSFVDEVTIGDASLLRLHDVKEVYVIGATEGSFPKAASESSLFSDSERRTLKALGVTLSEASDVKNAEELFFFYKSISAAAENVTISYPKATLAGKGLSPSLGVTRIQALFPNLTVIDSDKQPALAMIEDYDSAFEWAAFYSGTPLGDALLHVYQADPAYSARIEALGTPISNTDSHLSELFAKELYGGDLYVSQSRLDTFAKCEFSYHCKYTLGLQSTKSPEFKSVDIGNFMHMLLERFMNQISQNGHMDLAISRTSCEQIVDDIIKDYLRHILRDKQQISARMQTLIKRLRRTALLLIENILDEFRHSDFRPAFFELAISDPKAQEGLCVAPYAVTLPDGKQIYLYGKIDRVDCYRQDDHIYIRIVDYKTGTKNLSLDLIEKGQEMQMLLYLFAIWKTKDKAFLEKLGAKEGQLLPAGVQYYIAKASSLKLDNPQDAQDIYEEAKKKIVRNGILLKNDDILFAMDKTGTGQYLTKEVRTLEQFGEMVTAIETNICELGCQIKSGAAKANWKGEPARPCAYCDMKPICRKEG
ncbi:MAG: hypothetical protein HFE78_05455 [Clostridiales bacterium]|nr:hypothetical protein [Clostridiales bacterium]